MSGRKVYIEALDIREDDTVCVRGWTFDVFQVETNVRTRMTTITSYGGNVYTVGYSKRIRLVHRDDDTPCEP